MGEFGIDAHIQDPVTYMNNALALLSSFGFTLFGTGPVGKGEFNETSLTFTSDDFHTKLVDAARAVTPDDLLWINVFIPDLRGSEITDHIVASDHVQFYPLPRDKPALYQQLVDRLTAFLVQAGATSIRVGSIDEFDEERMVD